MGIHSKEILDKELREKLQDTASRLYEHDLRRLFDPIYDLKESGKIIEKVFWIGYKMGENRVKEDYKPFGYKWYKKIQRFLDLFS